MSDVLQIGKFIQGQLTKYDPKFYDTVYAELWGAAGKYHKATGSLPLGVQKLLAGRIDYVGEATLYDGNSTDILVSDFNIQTEEFQTKVIIAAAEWNAFDLATTDVAGGQLLPRLDFVGLKMKAVRRSLDTRLHSAVWGGVPKMNFQGLFTGRSVVLESIATNLYALAGYDLYIWVKNAINAFRETSLLTAEASVLMCPSRFYNRLLEPIGANYSTTPFQMLTDPKMGRSVRDIVEVNELKSDFLYKYGVRPDNLKDRLMLYQDTPDGIPEREFYPIDRTPPILQNDGFSYRVTSWLATSEMRFDQSFRSHYYDIPVPA